jgi:hypothetical protein
MYVLNESGLVLTSKSTVKHEHILVWFMIQQLTLLVAQTGLIDTMKIRRLVW